MLTKEISEVEKEILKLTNPRQGYYTIEEKQRYSELYTKLSTLKSAQQKFDKFVEDLKREFCSDNCIAKEVNEQIIDELSSKEGKYEIKLKETKNVGK
jgi:hypothetical protein